MRWVGHVAHLGGKRCIPGLVARPDGKNTQKTYTDGRILLIFK